MAEASIPVDPTNPGQVFACLGFTELAETLLGDAEGAFDWSGPETRFRLLAAGDRDPVQAALGFLREAAVVVLVPAGVGGDWPQDGRTSACFPSSGLSGGKGSKPMSPAALPVLLVTPTRTISLSHWVDATGRETFKLFAGQQQGHSIASDLLGLGKPVRGKISIRSLDADLGEDLARDPFGPTGSTKSSFGFDARGAWDALAVGAGLDALSIETRISPVVDLLAAIGLENARPLSEPRGVVRYAIWNVALPVSLARPALAVPEGIAPAVGVQRFRTHTGPSKYYKKFYFASKE